MARKFSYYRYLFLVSWILISLATGPTALSQHEGHNMPGMSKPKPKSKPKAKVKRRTASRRKKTLVRKRAQPPKKRDMSNMPGMQMPTTSPSPNPPASSEKMDMNMPMPSASPSASPHIHAPGMQMPASTPAAPTASPEKMDMNMPMPSQSPTARPAENKMPGMDMSKNGAMDMGPLLVMSGSDMAIRVALAIPM